MRLFAAGFLWFVAFAGAVAIEGIDFLAAEFAVSVGVEDLEVVADEEGGAEAFAFILADAVVAVGVGEEEDFAGVVERVRGPTGAGWGGCRGGEDEGAGGGEEGAAELGRHGEEGVVVPKDGLGEIKEGGNVTIL